MRHMKLSTRVTGLSIFLLVSGCGTLAPSEKEMEDNFKSNYSSFERIIKMLKEDSNIHGINRDGIITLDAKVLTEKNITSADLANRLKRYRELLEKIGCPKGVQWNYETKDEMVNTTNREIHFIYYHHSSAFGGRAVYYIYSEKQQKIGVNYFKRIDTLLDEEKRDKEINGYWYLFKIRV